jgi:hypothetical protein
MSRRSAVARSSVLSAASVFVVGCIAGCAGPTGDGSSPDEQIATYKTYGSSGGMQALNVGTLILDDGCLYTGSSTYETDGEPLTLVIFPEEFTTWDGTTLTVGDQSWKVGEAVQLGGGMVREPSRPYALDSSYSIPESCVVTDDVWCATAE